MISGLLFSTIIILDAYREIRKVGTGSIWHVPTRIYSSKTCIIPGDDIRLIGLRSRLERLRYRDVPEVSAPGEFFWSQEAVTLYLHSFEYPDRFSEAIKVKIFLDGTTIKEMIRLDRSESLGELVLEPEDIACVYDQEYEDRIVVELESCPPYLLKAIIATEDRRFYAHWGIDLRSVARAALVNVHHGRIIEGASTITQQLVKNLFLSSKRTFLRKIKETWMALIMDAVYSKQQILGMYINEVYLGQSGYVGIYGVGRASRLFFDKDVSQIDLAEAALIAGIIRAPNRYNPYIYPNRALARRNTVLKLMLDAGDIDQRTYDTAVRTALRVFEFSVKSRRAPYFVDYLLSTISDAYPISSLAKGGYRIFTTLDMHMQNVAETMLSHGIQNLSTSQRPVLQGSVVVCDPKSGRIKAMVGGREYASSQFNRAIQTKRNIGSLIKPIVYYSALRSGYTLASLIDDSPLSVKLADGSSWSPENYDKTSHGYVLLIDALINSYNVATARLGMSLGTDVIAKQIDQLRPGLNIRENPALLLGTLECSTLDVSMVYSAFANRGKSVEPSAIRQIVNNEGVVLFDSSHSQGQQVLDESVVFLVNSALKEVLILGTAKDSQKYGMPPLMSGKTGTTNDMRDAWFVGFSKDVTVVVWLGNDEFQPIGLSGAAGAMPIASMILSRIEKPKQWLVPPEIVMCSIDPKNGKLASIWSKNTRALPFVRGTQPTDVSKDDTPRLLKFLRSIFEK